MLWVLGVAIGAFALVAVFAKLAQILSLRIGRIQVSDLVYIYHGTGETFTLAHHDYCFGCADGSDLPQQWLGLFGHHGRIG